MMCTERLLVLLYEFLEHWEIREKEKRKETNVVRVSVGIAFKKNIQLGMGDSNSRYFHWKNLEMLLEYLYAVSLKKKINSPSFCYWSSLLSHINSQSLK